MQTSTATEQQSGSSIDTTSEVLLSTVLSLDGIEALRAKQREAYQTARYDSIGMLDTSAESEVTARLRAQEVTDTYMLDQFGVEPSPRSEATKNLLDTYSYTNYPDQFWYVAPEITGSNGGISRGMDRFVSDREVLTAAFPEAPLSDSAREELARGELLKSELAVLRDTLSSLSAKRQSRIAGGGGEVFATTHAAYMDRVIAIGKLENQAVLDDVSLSEQEKQVKVIEYIFSEQAKLREQTIEKLNGTKVGKFVEWMNRGKIATRVAKGLLIGTSVGLAAAGIGALAGIAGVATIGAGVGAVGLGAWRFARGFARADNNPNNNNGGSRGMAALPDMADHTLDGLSTITSTTHSLTENEYVETVAHRFADAFENDTKNEQHKRRKSVAWGLGGLAAGAALAGGIHLLLELNAHDIISKPHLPAVGGGNSNPIVPETSGTGIIPAPEPSIIPAFDNNYNIQPGEGGIHLFQRLGLTGTDWYNIQNDLLSKFPHDFYDPDGNGPIAVRIAHPGQLSVSAQEYIKQKFNLG